MAIPIDKPDLEARLGVDGLARYSLVSERGQEAADKFVAECIAAAWDSARSAGTNIFTPESWDAMTADTLPPEAKRHIVSDACLLVAIGWSTRPEFLDTMAAEAKQWRSWLAGDTVRCFDAVLTRIEERTDGAGVTFQVPDRKFDRATNDYWNTPRRG